MADISQIKLPNGDTHNFIDTTSGYTKNTGTITSVKTTAGAHSTINVTSGAANFNVPTTAAHVGIKFGYTTSGNNRAVLQDSSGNLYVTQKDDNTTYSSKAAASGGTDVSLVTTGEKYIWNSKTSNTGTITSVKTTAGAHSTINITSGAVNFNVPTKTSHLTNDSGFITSSALNNYLPLTGGQVTGPTTFGDTVSIDDLNAGQLVVSGSASVANGINTSTVHANTLTIQKPTVGSNTYADDNPKIIFQNGSASQNGSLTWTDYDSVQSPASLTLNGDQGGEYFIAPNIKATTRFYGPLTGAVTGHASSDLALTGGTLTGNLNLKYSGVDASKANNNVSSTVYPSAFNVLDTSERIIGRVENVVQADGKIGLYAYVRNYNTSGTQVAQKGIAMYMAKDGTLTYSVSDPAKFTSAISALPLSGGTLTGDLLFSDSALNVRQIQGKVGGNDYWRIAGGATATNSGWMEIATADDGAEPIYVRQYTGVYTTIKRTLTLLDANGDTTLPGNLNLDHVINMVLKGTGTAASDKGSGVSPRYFPAKWTFNIGRTPVDGDIIVIETPVAGHDYGVFLSIDNGSHYHPVTLSGTGRLTTHWPAGSYVALIFDSNNSAASMFAVNGADTRSTVTGGTWRSLNYYSSGNTYTQALCTTAAATAEKGASMSYYVATANRYVMVNMYYANTSATALTLNINGTGAKYIYINGRASS